MATSSKVLSVCGFSMKVVLLLLVLGSSSAEAKMVDLTHPFNSDSMHGPIFRDFEIKSTMKGNYAALGGIWVEANDVIYAEHTGTHIDAPAHTWETGIHVHEIPLQDLIGPAIVLNITQKALKDSNYLVTVQDFIDFEHARGRIPDGSIVLLNTDRAKYYWSDRSTYLGTVDIKNVSTYNNPGFSVESINWLVTKRNIKGIGIDCLNFDSGSAHHFPAHVAINSAGRFAIENINNLNKLPLTGATIFVMVVPVQNGSGGPARIVAFWDTDLPLYSSCGLKMASLMMVSMVSFITTLMQFS